MASHISFPFFAHQDNCAWEGRQSKKTEAGELNIRYWLENPMQRASIFRSEGHRAFFAAAGHYACHRSGSSYNDNQKYFEL